MEILNTYKNGNTLVTIFEDGTKERVFEGSAFSEFPESIDVKITNYCEPTASNPICAYCHEKSSLKGAHADLERLLKELSTLPAGVEIAIGGGNPLSHPQLKEFLVALKNQGLISNITINEKHISLYKDLIIDLISKDLIKGVGISYSSEQYLKDIEPIIKLSSNIVFHLIMGINKVNEIDYLLSFCNKNNKVCKILVLGYKQFGLGINYYIKNKNIEYNKYEWYVTLASYFKKNNLIISFDNLAINQLNLRRYFTADAWNNFYMGNDFTHSMYIDGVNQQYAPSSTSKNRVFFEDISLLSYFISNKISDAYNT